MKILFTSDLLAYGGASKLIFDLLPRMTVDGNECELLILSDKNSKYVDELRKQGIPVHIFPKTIRGHLQKVLYLKNWIKQGHYDVIHANLFPMTYYTSMAKKLLGNKCPPIVMTEHSTDNKRRHVKFLKPIEKIIYKEFDHVISISEKTQENLLDWIGIDCCRNYSVILNGIDLDCFRTASALRKDELFPNYKIGDVLLLTVGSFTIQKNHSKLIEAMSLLPDCYKLVLCGEGPLETEIKKQVSNRFLDSRVFFMGFRKDIAQIMHTADILVIPSLWEGFGLVAAEGMACGIKIASSNIPGLSEVVGSVGVKFDPNYPTSIASQIIQLDSKDTSTNSSDINFLLERYDINTTSSKYLELYNSLFEIQTTQ